MGRHKQTFSWLFLLTFVLGGLVAPSLHFQQHITEGDRRPVAGDEPVVCATPSFEYVDCSLCDARLLATPLASADQEVVTFIETVSQRAPQRLALNLIGNTSNRGPPVLLHS